MRKPFCAVAASLLAVIVAAPPAFGQAAPTGRASVRGTITAGGRPLAGVLVMRSLSGDSTRSDSLGRYAIRGLGAGRHIFEVRKRGFAPIEMEINFPTDTTGLVGDIPMESSAAGDAVLNEKLAREGFTERRRRAQERDRATFIGPDEIEEKQALRVSQLFDGVRDVVVRFERGISVLYGGGDGRCVMYAWIEHQRLDNAFPPAGSALPSSRGASSATHYTGLDELIPLSQIAAIEIYPRPSQVPQDYQRSSQQVAASSRGRDLETRSAECGAIIIWTR
jgi:hypothetical protein